MNPSPPPPTHGSLFAGYDGLGLAVEQTFGARTVWVSDIEPGPSKILAHRLPQAPNLGDITAITWTPACHCGTAMQVAWQANRPSYRCPACGVRATVSAHGAGHPVPVEILTGGSPCQDISGAGRMAGMREGTRSNLWVEMRQAISLLRPRLVVWENVYAALSTGADSGLESCPRCVGNPASSGKTLRVLGRVLGDLAEIGYDAQWVSLPASGVGACHRRIRVFVTAWPSQDTDPLTNHWRGAWPMTGSVPQFAPPESGGLLLPTPRASDGTHGGPNQRGSKGDLALPAAVMRLLPTPGAATDVAEHQLSNPGKYGDYGPAIERHARMFGRQAPDPTVPNRRGDQRLSPRFVEWMMMLPEGWVCDVPEVSGPQLLRALGNGVVPAQAVAALVWMLSQAELDLTGWSLA